MLLQCSSPLSSTKPSNMLSKTLERQLSRSTILHRTRTAKHRRLLPVSVTRPSPRQAASVRATTSLRFSLPHHIDCPAPPTTPLRLFSPLFLTRSHPPQ